jgi:hypothetical protein
VAISACSMATRSRSLLPATMISKADGTITLRGRTEPIERFVVWFQTPFGLIDDFELAKQRVSASDFDVDLNVVPVSVALGATLHELCGQ